MCQQLIEVFYSLSTPSVNKNRLEESVNARNSHKEVARPQKGFRGISFEVLNIFYHIMSQEKLQENLVSFF